MNEDPNINDLTGAEARAVLHVIRQGCIREGYNPAKETLLGWIINKARSAGAAGAATKAERKRICDLLRDQAAVLREAAKREFVGHPVLQEQQRVKAVAYEEVIYDINETAPGGRFNR